MFCLSRRPQLHYSALKQHVMMVSKRSGVKVHIFYTLAHEGGEWSALYSGHLITEKGSLVPIQYQAELASDPVWLW
jgi:hypothetical protein